VRSILLDVETENGVKPVEFFYGNIFEYFLGMKSENLKRHINCGRFPDTPYVKEQNAPKKGIKARLYTRKMVEEAVELYELYYPPYYRGRDPVLKELYAQEMKEYEIQVKKLQDQWVEKDYLAIAETQRRPWKKTRKIQ
jgi:hypothetical protein